MAATLKAGFNRHVRDLNHGTLANAILSVLVTRFLGENDESLSLSDLAKECSGKLEHVIATCEELSAKELIRKNDDGPWSAVSEITPYKIVIQLAVSQKDLFGDAAAAPATPKNPLGLFLNHSYRLADGTGTMEFRGYNPDDEVYSFYSPNKELGMLRGDEGWVRHHFDLENLPKYDGSLALREIGPIEADELSADGLIIRRFSPERMDEFASIDASKTLARKNPTAKEIAEFSDRQWVVTGVVGEGAERVIYLTPVTPAGADEKDRVFKAGKNRYQLGAPETRIVAMETAVDEIAKAEPADPTEFVKSLAEKGFASEGALSLKPRSFTALWQQTWPEETPDFNKTILVENVTVSCDPDNGIEIDGYEEPAATPEPEAKIEVGDPTFHWPAEEYEDRGLVEVVYKEGFEQGTDLFVFSWEGGFVNHRVPSDKVDSKEPMGDVVKALVLALVPKLGERPQPAAEEAAPQTDEAAEPEEEE